MVGDDLKGRAGPSSPSGQVHTAFPEFDSATPEQLAAMVDLLAICIAETPAAIAMFDRQMRYLAVSKRFVADYGLAPDTQTIGRSHYEVFPEIPERWRAIHRRVLEGESMSRAEDAFPRLDGRVDWIRWHMEPWRDAAGDVGGALLFSEVITAQVEARSAQSAAEARLRAVVETAVDAIVIIDDAGIIQSANPATKTLFGHDVDDLCGRNVSLLMPEPHRSAHDAYIATHLKTGVRRIIGLGREVEGVRKDGSSFPIDLAVAEWRIDGRQYFTGIMRDISARKLAEAQRAQAERRELVLRELRHRISNMFAVIQGLVVASARSHQDVAAYRDAVLARITAFAATQVQLVEQPLAGLSLRELFEFELGPYRGAEARIDLAGGTLNLNGAAAESLAMVVHELATNSAKYGALSAARGKVGIRWRMVSESGDDPRIVLSWTETGGPPVKPPVRRGFGSTVIESCSRALGGRASLDHLPTGLRCEIDLAADLVLLREHDEQGRAADPDAPASTAERRLNGARRNRE
jgi:PAS domain S-box-containing protein